MPDRDIPENVRRLIAEHIVSVEQLEMLLLLCRGAEEEWTAARVSEEMRTSLISAEQRLEDLAQRGLLAKDASTDPAYRFAPKDAGLARAVADLAELYAERRYTVIELIFSKPIDNLRVYADAFRIRKDESDG